MVGWLGGWLDGKFGWLVGLDGKVVVGWLVGLVGTM